MPKPGTAQPGHRQACAIDRAVQAGPTGVLADHGPGDGNRLNGAGSARRVYGERGGQQAS
jgi:hypothetical protein